MHILSTIIEPLSRVAPLVPALLRSPRKIERLGLARPLSVCIIAGTGGFGGTEIHTLALIGALLKRRHSVTLIVCSDTPYEEHIASQGWQSDVRVIHSGLSLNVRTADEEADTFLRWKKLLDDARSDVLILSKGANRAGNLLFLLLCRRSFANVFWIEHLEADPPPPRASTQWFRERLVHKLRSRCVDRIIAVSNQVRNRLVRDWGYRPDRIVVIHNGVPWREFSRNAERGASLRAQYRVPSDAFTFGMVARLHPDKGIDIALRALRLLLDKAPAKRVHLLIAGDGSEAEPLKQLAGELGLDSLVTFLGFVRNPKDLFSAYDAILFPSRREGLPLALLEGMAAGCIPIVSRVAGMPEAVNSPDVGWVVPPNSPEQLCSAMYELLALSPANLLQMRQNTHRTIRDDFDIDECHRRILRVCGL
jgi:glycosyltransferase involved in cell wall biosynthesis